MPTLSSILGKHYKWWYIIKYYFKVQTAYRGNNILYSLGGVASALILVMLWKVNADNGSRLDLSQIVTYLWIGNILTLLAPVWFSDPFSAMIFEGKLTSKLLRPTSFFWFSLVESIGRGCLATSYIFVIPLIIGIPLLGGLVNGPATMGYLLLSLGSVVVCYLIKFVTEFLTGCVTFWTTNYDGMLFLKDTLTLFLMGSFLPLHLIHPWLAFNPYAWIFYHPAQIYQGKYDITTTWLVLLGGVGWFIGLWILSQLVFRAGLKRYECVGL